MMNHWTVTGCLVALLAAFFVAPSSAARAIPDRAACNLNIAKTFPKRNGRSGSGSSFVEAIRPVAGSRRDELVTREVLDGNVPGFIRTLTPVTLSGKLGGETVNVTICVTPDYLSIGEDRDFVRVPVGLPAAARIASGLGFFLPTTKMVDAIYLQATVKLAPQPMPPTSQMQSTDYFWAHNRTVDDGRARAQAALGDLTAGQKKDIVLTNRLRSQPGRVAIYGWHRKNGKPIQPLSTVHGAEYADYSHGVRLVSSKAFVNGQPRNLGDILQDSQLSQIVSSEGPISGPDALLRSFQ